MERPSLTASIAVRDRIRGDIIAGALPFGSRLTLDGLALRYAVGHMPVREALRDLQVEGLVELAPNRGARVRAVDTQFVRDIFDLRIVIEAMLARRAAERIDARQVDKLCALQDTFESRAAYHDYTALLTLNREFHRAINDAASSPEAAGVLDRHWGLIAALWNRYGYGEHRSAAVSTDHRQLIAAFRARDVEVASCLAMAHAARAKQELIARMLAQDSAKTPVAA